jgi:hypothetical protein
MSRKKETIHEYLRRRLAGCVGMHNQISSESGVPQSTVNRIYLEADGSPRLSSVQPLLDWFEAFDRAGARERARRSATRRGAGNRVFVGRGAPRAAAKALG